MVSPVSATGMTGKSFIISFVVVEGKSKISSKKGDTKLRKALGTQKSTRSDERRMMSAWAADHKASTTTQEPVLLYLT